jgi:hypothetical protein
LKPPATPAVSIPKRAAAAPGIEPKEAAPLKPQIAHQRSTTVHNVASGKMNLGSSFKVTCTSYSFPAKLSDTWPCYVPFVPDEPIDWRLGT